MDDAPLGTDRRREAVEVVELGDVARTAFTPRPIAATALSSSACRALADHDELFEAVKAAWDRLAPERLTSITAADRLCAI